MDTSRDDGVKASLHNGTPRSCRGRISRYHHVELPAGTLMRESAPLRPGVVASMAVRASFEKRRDVVVREAP